MQRRYPTPLTATSWREGEFYGNVHLPQFGEHMRELIVTWLMSGGGQLLTVSLFSTSLDFAVAAKVRNDGPHRSIMMGW